MAKLQGHFLKHRDNEDNCFDNALEIIKEDEIIQEMTVGEWLDRLNLIKYLPMFIQKEIYLVEELRHHVDDKGNFNDKFKFKDPLEQMRIALMIRGDKNAKQDFKFQSVQSSRRMIQKFVKSN